jgi:hypothetical protein
MNGDKLNGIQEGKLLHANTVTNKGIGDQRTHSYYKEVQYPIWDYPHKI